MLFLVAAPALIIPTPPAQNYVIPAPTQSAVAPSAASLLFPSTFSLGAALTSLDDELERAAEIQRAQDAKIDAQVRAVATA